MRLLAIAIIITLLPLFAPAQSVPPLVNYQGRLTDASGNPMTGAKKVEINIYSGATGGSAVWGPQTFDNVMLVNGEFNIVLSMDASQRAVTDAFDSPNAYLGIKVGNAEGSVGPELQPRQQFLAVPYSVRSLDSDSANVDALIARIDALEDLIVPPGGARVIRTYGPSTCELDGGSVAIDSEGSVFFSGVKDPGVVDFGGGPLDSEFVCIVLVKLDRFGAHVWSKQFPTESNFTGNSARHSLAIDSGDNVFLAATHLGQVDFGGGNVGMTGASRMSFVKFDNDGNELWSDSYHFGTLDGKPPRVAVAPNGDMILGAVFSSSTVTVGQTVLENVGRSDIVFARFAGADGTPVWARRYGSTHDEAIKGIAISPAGDIFLSGEYRAPMLIGTIQLSHHGQVSNSYYYRPFYARIGGDGIPVWAKGFAPQSASLTHTDYAGGIGLDSDGNIWTNLYFVGARDFGGGATGTGTTSYLGLLSFDADGDWRANIFWPGFQRDGMRLAVLEDAPLSSGLFSTNTGVNFGGAELGTGLLTLAMERGIGETALEHRFSSSVGGTVVIHGDMDLRDGVIAQVGSYTGSVDFGSGAVTPGSGSGIFLLLRQP